MVCGADGSIKLWSVETGTPTNLILSDYGLDLTCIDLSSNRQWLAQGTTNQGLQIVQLPSDSESVIAPFIFKLSFSLKGKLVTVYGFTIFLSNRTKLYESQRDSDSKLNPFEYVALPATFS